MAARIDPFLHKWAGLTLGVIAPVALTLAACGDLTDPATRLAFDLEKAASIMGGTEGATYTLRHAMPSKEGECEGPYKVQVDKAGALVVWCHDANGAMVSSHVTSYHNRFVDTPETHIVDKAARSELLIQIERRSGRAVITRVD